MNAKTLPIKTITVTSEKNIGSQILKDHLTPTEKKILIHMLNEELNQGQVRNKVFNITKSENNSALVVIGTITKSIILRRDEIVTRKVQIKYA